MNDQRKQKRFLQGISICHSHAVVKSKQCNAAQVWIVAQVDLFRDCLWIEEEAGVSRLSRSMRISNLGLSECEWMWLRSQWWEGLRRARDILSLAMVFSVRSNFFSDAKS